jgi:hypothetical protein
MFGLCSDSFRPVIQREAAVFQVGRFKYRLRITEEPLFNQEGEELEGRCVERERLLLISCKVPVGERLAVLLHELYHAWLYAIGRAGDVEGECDRYATMVTHFWRDMCLFGGEEAIRSLRPGETLGAVVARIAFLGSRNCRCGETVPSGRVFCYRDAMRVGQVKLSIYCGFCNHTLRWNELATVAGQPGGVVVTGSDVIERGNTIGPEAEADSYVSTPCEI